MNEEAICKYCGKTFIRKHPSTIFCSYECRYQTHKAKNKDRKGRCYRAYDKEQYPNAARIQCRKCDEWFESWDKIKNRLCHLCQESNKNIRNNTSAYRSNPMKGYPHNGG